METIEERRTVVAATPHPDTEPGIAIWAQAATEEQVRRERDIPRTYGRPVLSVSRNSAGVSTRIS